MGRTKSEAMGLNALRKRVDQWRTACGGKRRRVPEDIWSAAVAVARTAGPWATSKATRLNYRSLTEQMGARNETPQLALVGDVEGEARESPVAFVEVALPALPAARESAGKTVVELEGRGKRLRIETTGALDVVGLAQAFWRDARCSN